MVTAAPVQVVNLAETNKKKTRDPDFDASIGREGKAVLPQSSIHDDNSGPIVPPSYPPVKFPRVLCLCSWFIL